jgi:hypothetical protein
MSSAVGLMTCLRVSPTRRPDTANVSATSCDVGFFFSVSYVVSLFNCQHVVGVTTYHSIILAKRMVRTFFSNNNMVKRGGPNGRPYNPPWPLAPQPFRPLFDCCVVVVWDQAAQLHSATWSQNRCALNPNRPKKWKNPLIKPKPPHHPPAVSAQTPSSYV